VADTAPRVTAVVVTYGHEDEIAACVDALLAQQVDGGLEVVVVDNASPDGTVEVLRGYGDAVVLLEQPSNTGYAAATNTAADRARGELLLLVNPDCVVDEGCVQRLVDHLDDTPGVGAASALLRYPDGRPQLFCRRDPTLASVLWDLTEAGRRVDRRFRQDAGRDRRRYAAEFGATGPSGVLEVDCPAAACVLLWHAPVRAQVMSPELPLFFNDGDLYDRLRAKAYVVHVVPSATAAHGYSTSLQRLAAARKRAEFVASMRVLARRWWPLRRRLALWLLLVLDAGTALLLSLRGRDRSRARTHARGTLGGLGLPGGAAPWLATFPPPAARLRRTAASCRDAAWSWLDAARRRRRRRLVLRRLRWQARLSRSRLVLDVDRSADVARDLRVELRRGTVAVLRVGPRAALHSGVLLRLWGGELVLGAGAQVRHGACLTVKGRLRLGARCTVSRGANVHADGEMDWGFGASAAEGATVLDTEHRLSTLLPIFDLPVVHRPVSVGAGAFIGANAVVTAGVRIGERAVVGAGSVVTRDVAPGTLVLGQPARPRAASRDDRPREDR
jgi:N-acetylglucosaminyl-diphospho-decaprenol L-rhamnosyltransferase